MAQDEIQQPENTGPEPEEPEEPGSTQLAVVPLLEDSAPTPVVVDGQDAEEEETEGKYRLPFLVVGIGASAGGLEACIPLIERLPADTGMAFVILLHLAPDLKSHLPQILERRTSMPVTEIRDGDKPQPNHIYVLAANQQVRLIQGVFRVETRRAEFPPRPIDVFFRSLATSQKNRTIGIVLSGMDADGAMGLKAIKGEGGIAIVQSPESARFPDMPRTSISADHVDMVLVPDAIGAQLAQLARQFASPEMRSLEDGVQPIADENHFGRILALMRGVSGIDYRLYKPNTIRRRIARRMLLHRVGSLGEYESYLRANPREVRELQEDALINVTRFFRDPDVFETLKAVAFPHIFDSRAADAQVRVWVAGCSTGEEVYSLAISMLEYLTGRNEEPSLQIFGTDASESNIQKARAAIYSETVTADVSPDRLRRFFVKNEKGYQVAKRVRDLCIFARQNLCHDPPFSRMDLISCRNVLIYFGSTLQRQLIPTFHYALRSDGFLLLGTSETIREFTDLFSLIDRRNKIFVKTGTAPSRPFVEAIPQVFAPDLVSQGPQREPADAWGDVELQRAADRIVLARFGPPGVVINERLEILQSRGHTSAYFEIPSGPTTFSLARMARREIAPQLTDAVRRAIETDSPVQTDLVSVAEDDGKSQITVEILPIHSINARPRCFLVLFVASRSIVAGVADPEPLGRTTADRDQIATKLRQDLASTRLYLQSLLEERDAKNQELVSANEEIQSANEELQSTNEELETTKEELQSSNEELQTVNDELQNRNSILTQASNDLSNLLNSVSLPVLMLSNELNIRHFTPPAQRLMNVRPSDIGRPFAEIRMNLEIETLEPLLQEVLDTLNAREVEVQDREGRWHLLRVRPYRTVDNKIEGLVVVLVDIDQLRRSQQELREARDFARLVVESIPLPVAVLDLDFRIRSVNEAFCTLAAMSAPDLEKRSLPELANSLWGLEQPLRAELARLRTPQNAATNFEFIHQIKAPDERTLSIRGCVLQPDGESFLLVTIEDITAHKKVERLLEEEGKRLSVQIDSATRELARSREELRALARSLFTSQEEERRRVARELHDDISQRLAAIELAGDEVEREISKSPAATREKLKELRANISHLSRDVRGISHRLHPAIIEDLGLAPGLRALITEFRDREGMITDFFEEPLPQMAPEVPITLYRIAQEALRNIAKHAGKTHVKLSLRQANGGIELRIQDAGIGFDTKSPQAGLGLVSMEERARQIGASFRVESAPGRGTTVSVDVPPPAE